MRSHANARLSPIGRQLLVDRVVHGHWPVPRAADAAGVSTRTAAKWLIVIGASHLGLEMAEALVLRGLDVTLVDRGAQVMPPLDPDMAAHVQAAAEGAGIRVLLSTDVQEIRADTAGRPCAVITSHEEPAADHVVLSTGTRPATELAAAAGLPVGATGALRVDDRQRCPGHDGVYAAGDCAEARHRLLADPVNVQLGTHADKQGRIAGTNATDGDAAFPGVLGYHPGAGPIWVKLVASRDTGRLLGGQIVGMEGAAKRIDVLATAVWSEMGVDELELLDLRYAPPFSGVYDPLLIAARQTTKRVEAPGRLGQEL